MHINVLFVYLLYLRLLIVSMACLLVYRNREPLLLRHSPRMIYVIEVNLWKKDIYSINTNTPILH